jgi:hypothetical protein
MRKFFFSFCILKSYDLFGPGSISGIAKFSLHHRVQTGSEAHLASYPMGTEGKATGE